MTIEIENSNPERVKFSSSDSKGQRTLLSVTLTG
jgi:hypothetical protein